MHMHIPREACGSAAWGKLSGAAGCIPRIPTAWDSPSRNEAPGTLSGSSALIASRCTTHPWLPRHSSQRALVPRVIDSGVTLLVRRPAWGTWLGKNHVSCCDTGIMTATSIRLRCSFGLREGCWKDARADFCHGQTFSAPRCQSGAPF